MTDAFNESIISFVGTTGLVHVPVDLSATAQSPSLLENSEQLQDPTKPYRVAFKGKLTNGERSSN